MKKVNLLRRWAVVCEVTVWADTKMAAEENARLGLRAGKSWFDGFVVGDAEDISLGREKP